jgi:hypothetical protein
VQKPHLNEDVEVNAFASTAGEFTPKIVDTKNIDLPSFMRDWPQNNH